MNEMEIGGWILWSITGGGYALVMLFMVGAVCINPRDPVDPPATAGDRSE
ncbi:hypothetical protein M1D97_10485 [Kushneria sp. AK178]